jgi:two-component system sensor histidine kinase/response regulator
MEAPTRRAVLVAEDNAISREILLHQLEMLGCEAVGAEDGATAVRAWRGGEFALLLTDLQMPGLDGYELAALIRSEESAQRMPIVALTANVADAEANRCVTVGMNDYLTKPASLATLRRVVDRWIGSAATTALVAHGPGSGGAT